MDIQSTQRWRGRMTKPKANTGNGLLRGFLGRCPACGTGRLFRAFTKVADHCPACGEAFHHHRADDFPAYVVIVVVGHIVVPLAMIVEIAYQPSYWLHAAIWLPLVLALGIGLLQPVKGLIVALQWQMGMHGFAEAKLARR
ncbi:MAG: DUF983 domain-containing protein [Proteobacteria bacterium]|nr:DUF983 domain-containing protein [Pseudomonadota bacterium]